MRKSLVERLKNLLVAFTLLFMFGIGYAIEIGIIFGIWKFIFVPLLNFTMLTWWEATAIAFLLDMIPVALFSIIMILSFSKSVLQKLKRRAK